LDLKAIYLTTLELCRPENAVRPYVDETLPRHVVSIGKCAGALLDGVAALLEIESAFVALPRGYPPPRTPARVHFGGHPDMTTESFAAGRAMLDYLATRRDVLFLISGGGSACVEVAAPGIPEEAVAAENARLVSSGLPIGAINARRRELSAIKGGLLRKHVSGRAVTFVYSDVAIGAAADVASGPTITTADEAIVIADNRSLTNAAARLIGDEAVTIADQIDGDVDAAAELLALRAGALRRGQILVAGGEPTVVVHGPGKGGRCSELAVRFAARASWEALFASSDGVDGNSGVAGWHLPRRAASGLPTGSEGAMGRSDSSKVAAQVGEPIMIAPTGNNLRDLFLVGR
jgi:glycerate 2-kinase